MSRRRVTIAMHWGQFLMLLGLTSTDNPTAPWVTAYAALSLAFPLVALILGLHGRPGPKLTPPLPAIHQWGHRAMYLLVAASGALSILWLLGHPVRLQYWLFLLFMVSNLHAVFHLWRHTALMDGALRTITPRALHKIL